MKEAPLPPNESERLADLYALEILDTPPDDRFDRITSLIQTIFNVPIALVTLVDSDRQWFKSRQGIDLLEGPRTISFCGHTILDNETMIIPDMLLDERFVDNPYVCEQPNIRFYAGHPLTTPKGNHVGTLCILDVKPRYLRQQEIEILQNFAEIAQAELNVREVVQYQQELTKINQELTREVKKHKQAVTKLNQSETRFRTLMEQAADAFFLIDMNSYRIVDVNQKACDSLGYTREELLFLAMFDIETGIPAEAVQEMAEKVTAGVLVTTEGRHRRKDKSEFPVEIRVNRLTLDNEDTYSLALVRDISERKLIEANQTRFSKQLQIAADVSKQINAILDPDLLMIEIVNLLQSRFNLYYVHIYLLDHTGQQLIMQAGSGEVGKRLNEQGHKIPLEYEQSLVAQAARSLKPVLVNNTGLDPNFLPNPLLPDTKAEAAVPIIAGDQVLGVFDVQDDQSGRFQQSDIDTFSTLSGQIAIALENARLFAESEKTAKALSRQEQRLRSLYDITTEAGLDIDKQLDNLVAVTNQLLDLDIGIISRIEDNAYTVLHCSAPPDTIVTGQIFELGDTYCVETLNTEDVLTIEHAENSQYQEHPCYQKFQLEAYIGTVLTVNGKRFGTLNFSSPTPRETPFTQADQDFIRLLGKTISTTLERKYAEEALFHQNELERLVTTISARFISLSPDEFDEGINDSLQDLGEYAGVDRSYIFDHYEDDEGAFVNNTHEWCAPGVDPQIEYLQGLPMLAFPWFTPQLYRIETIHAPRVNDLPEEAAAEKELLQSQGIQSVLMVPMSFAGKFTGFIGFDFVKIQSPLSEENIALLKVVSDIFVNALQRKQDQEELITALAQAVEANRIKTELLARVSHELRTPLNAIIGYTDMLQEQVHGTITARQQQTLERIFVNGKKLMGHINGLLDQAQIEKGTIQLQLVSFRPADLIDNIQSVLAPTAQMKGVELTSYIDDKVPDTLQGDLQRLQDILINLGGNAIKFIEAGTVDVTIYQPNEEHWALQVSDTGPGIAAEDQTYIFESFRQVDGSMTRQHSGVGLGLSIVKQLTELMGGEITLESELGQGSTFTIILPIIPPQETK